MTPLPLILLLCPGQNGDGRLLYEQPGWHALAREQGLGEEALNYRSPERELTPESRRGYFYAESGSHARLIGELTPKYGKNFRLAIFGYSGGAHFAHRFTQGNPERVAVWCAYSAGWWDDPPAARPVQGAPTAKSVPPGDAMLTCPATSGATRPAFPPGLILCGERDPRRAACADYFLACRRNRLPVCWAQLPGAGHELAPAGRELAQVFLRQTLILLRTGDAAPDPMPEIDDPWPARSGVRVTLTLPQDTIGPVALWFPDRVAAEAWRRLAPPPGEILRIEGDTPAATPPTAKTTSPISVP